MLEDSLSVDELLGQESSGGDHCKTTVLQLLGLHKGKIFGILRLQAKGIKVQVTGDVFVTEKTGLVDGDFLGFDPADFGTGGLGLGDSGSQEDPEDGVDLSEVSDSGARDLSVEENGLALDGFTDEETDSGKHGYSSVRELGLTVSLKRRFIGLVGESQGIKETDRVKGTGDGVDGEGLVKMRDGRT